MHGRFPNYSTWAYLGASAAMIEATTCTYPVYYDMSGANLGPALANPGQLRMSPIKIYRWRAMVRQISLYACSAALKRPNRSILPTATPSMKHTHESDKGSSLNNF